MYSPNDGPDEKECSKPVLIGVVFIFFLFIVFVILVIDISAGVYNCNVVTLRGVGVDKRYYFILEYKNKKIEKFYISEFDFNIYKKYIGKSLKLLIREGKFFKSKDNSDYIIICDLNVEY